MRTYYRILPIPPEENFTIYVFNFLKRNDYAGSFGVNEPTVFDIEKIKADIFSGQMKRLRGFGPKTERFITEKILPNILEVYATKDEESGLIILRHTSVKDKEVELVISFNEEIFYELQRVADSLEVIASHYSGE